MPRRPPPLPSRAIVLAALQAVALAAGTARAAEPTVPLRLETELRESNLTADVPRPTFARGDSIEGRTGRETTLSGNAEVRRGGTVVRADRITLYEADDEVIAVGRVRITREGQVFTGPSLQLKLDSQEGAFESPSYYLPLNGGRGSARRVEFLGRDRVALQDATYTTCRPDDPDWHLKADTLELDRTEGEGTGTGATLYVRDVPVAWTPWFEFPLADERRSGFLAPTLSLTSTVGGEVRLPYYWNIAPNRDFTLLTNLTGRRGLQLGGIARYLEPQHFGTTSFEINPDDRETGHSRWLVNSVHNSVDIAGWSGGWLIRGVSDDRYFIDYSRSVVQSAERSLPRDAWATRAFGEWVVRGRVLSYQNILEARDAPPYDRLPQVTLTRLVRDLYGFDVDVNADTTRFSRDLPGSALGNRLIVNPAVSYPVGGPSWFVTPKASLHATAYRLEANPSGPLDIDRTVPTFSLDGGLVMERSMEIGGRSWLQTLEPRLLYVYTPYRDQSAIPVFDSTVSNLSFTTIFAENLFAGGDRIADANQLTIGAISRFIDPSNGVESLRLAAAQRLYFEDQRVTIPGVPTRTDPRSDILVAASGDLGANHYLDAGVQVGVRDGRIPRFGVSWRWWPAHDRLFNLALRFQERDYAQIDTSWRWPIARRWNSLGRINYSFLREELNPATGTFTPVDPQLLQGVLGVEYLADCWIMRVVAQRFVTASAQRTTAVFVQFELSGLARIGQDPFDILTRSIPGYRSPSMRTLAPSRFYGYE